MIGETRRYADILIQVEPEAVNVSNSAGTKEKHISPGTTSSKKRIRVRLPVRGAQAHRHDRRDEQVQMLRPQLKKHGIS